MRLSWRSAHSIAVALTGVVGCDVPVPVAVDAGVVSMGTLADAADIDAVVLVADGGIADDGGVADVVVVVVVADGGIADAGVIADVGVAGARGTQLEDAPKEPGLAARPKTSTIYDRLVVKPKDAKATPAIVKAAVEKQTKMSVSSVRVTARRFFLVEMAPTRSKRGKDDQARLVQRLRESPAFSSVEADRLMQLR